VISLRSFNREAPPVPEVTLTKPDFFSIPIILRITTGLVFTLPAIHSEVHKTLLEMARRDNI
jgi:hypothetical protein